MTGPNPETEGPETRPVSVAELLARNGTIGAPAATRRRRRRRGDNDAVSVAELPGDIPVIGAYDHADIEPSASAVEPSVEPRPDDGTEPGSAQAAYWSKPEPRWPKSGPQSQRGAGPERSAYPRPLGSGGGSDTEQRRAGL